MYALDDVAAHPEPFRTAVAERLPYKPLYVKMKVIFGCNLQCEMCNHWRYQRQAPLSMERLHAVVKELADLGCRKIHISGGEPLLRPHIPELIAYATELGIRTVMTTNGTLIDKELAKRLITSGLRGINVSLDAPEPRIHDKVRGVRGAWKKTTRAIAYVHRWQHKGKLTLRVNTVVSRINYDSLVGLPDLVHSLGATNLNLIGVDDHCGEHLSLHRRHIEEFNAVIAPRIAERSLALGLMTHEHEAYPFGWSRSDIGHATRGHFALGWYTQHPCFAPWTHSMIDFDGGVYVCCMMRERVPPVGNVHEQSFTDIWNGVAYAQARQRMHPPDFPSCACCDDFIAENRQLLEIVEGEKLTFAPLR